MPELSGSLSLGLDLGVLLGLIIIIWPDFKKRKMVVAILCASAVIIATGFLGGKYV